LEENGAEYREHRDGGSDAEAENDDRRREEPWRATQAAQSDADRSYEIVHRVRISSCLALRLPV
jgi:hypothetical protein